MSSKTKSKARQKFLATQSPHKDPNFSEAERRKWIDTLCNGFVQPSSANKAYYKVVVETLWPVGHGIPGPHVTEDSIRGAINTFRRDNKFGKDYEKPYIDVFRRVRELQGEEGLTGVARTGKTYQLVSLEISQKRVPRVKLSDADWEEVKKKYGNSCACCGKKEPDVRFQQDHKIPRTRVYDDSPENWQPLCDECNNFKSVSCRACELDCKTCCWAFPEKYRPLKISPALLLKFNSFCKANGLDPVKQVEKILMSALQDAR